MNEEFPRSFQLLSPLLPHHDPSLRNLSEWAKSDQATQHELLNDRSYWQRVCSQRAVEDQQFQAEQLALRPTDGFSLDLDCDALTARMVRDGYFQAPSSSLRFSADAAPFDYVSLADSVARLMQLGWPPTFFLVFDEAWEMARHFSSLVQRCSGGNRNNLDLLLWHIDPRLDQAGFAPHRDRQPADSPGSFRPDMTPMYATCWVPLTDACSDNSCLFVLPRPFDPGYFEGDADDAEGSPLEVALRSKEDYQNIRCLAAPQGSACVFSHRIIHWGSRGREGYDTPRVAFSVACSDEQFEEPYFSRAHLPFPPLSLRVALAAGQMLIYHERYNFPQATVKLFYQLFNKEARHFSRKYVDQVRFEFISASSSASAAAAGGEASEAEEDEEALDLMLDAMLDRETRGNYDIEDDFDTQFSSSAPVYTAGTRKAKRMKPSRPKKSKRKLKSIRPK